jgi:hypothetical protein
MSDEQEMKEQSSEQAKALELVLSQLMQAFKSQMAVLVMARVHKLDAKETGTKLETETINVVSCNGPQPLIGALPQILTNLAQSIKAKNMDEGIETPEMERHQSIIVE